MTQTYNDLPRWALWIAGLAIMSLVLTAGGLSLMMNITAGLGVGVLVAVAFGNSDVTKVLVPIVCQATGWDSLSKWTYRAASIISVLCADFESVLARAEALDVPIYIHPGLAPDEVFEIYYSNMRPEYQKQYQDYIIMGPAYG